MPNIHWSLVLAKAIALGLAGALCAEAQSRVAPYPPSAAIREVVWAPTNTIIRQARDGDNWPVTWATDDTLYATWGDGTGFEPKVETKLSCGFARVSGSPPNFTGENIRSPAEQLGQGRNGLKSWGILAIKEVLYLWFGHSDKRGGEARLAWSQDGARTWTFADWNFSEFGLVGFVNFGRGYENARDNFVYAYSHDGPKADTPADHFILMRAPKDRLAKREAWEFFAGVDASSRPRWTISIGERQSVFRHRDGCLRSAMTYHAGLRRYLWWQQIPQPAGHPDRGDTRFEGGFAIYDAPEPWGPWTTAYFAPKWDVGPGEHGDFPTKWASRDGRTAWLVFSGEDAFSVRQATFILRSIPSADRRNRPGPWDQDVLVHRIDTNGVAQRMAVFERAGVPTLARWKARLIAAHQHFPEDDGANFDKVAVHFSSDEGRTWTAPQVIQLQGLPEGMRFPFDPTLVPLPDGRIRLYFTSVCGRRMEEHRPAIYSAISTNGIDYVFEPGARFAIEGRPVIDCAVALHRGVFHLYAPDNGTRMPGGPPDRERPEEQPPAGTGYHATSKDGLKFTREADVTIVGARFRWLGNAQSDGSAITFYGTADGPGGKWIATSPDGANWKLEERPVRGAGADPGAVKLRDGSLVVVGTGPPRPGTPSAERRRRPPEN